MIKDFLGIGKRKSFIHDVLGLPRIDVLIRLLLAIFTIYGLVALVQLVGELIAGLQPAIAFMFPYGASPLIKNETLTLSQAVAIYLPINILLLSLTYFYSDIKKVNIKRYLGLVAGFRSMVSLIPVFELAYKSGQWIFGFQPYNDISIIIASTPGGIFTIILYIFGGILGLIASALFVDQLTEKILILHGKGVYNTVAMLSALLVTLLVIHEPGHVVIGTLMGGKISGLGLTFPVGAYTSFSSLPQSFLPLTLTLMGGNIFTLVTAFLLRDVRSGWSRYLGMMCAWSTFLNSTIPIAIGYKNGFLVGIGGTSDGALFFMVFAKVSIFLIPLALLVTILFALKSLHYFITFLKQEQPRKIVQPLKR